MNETISATLNNVFNYEIHSNYDLVVKRLQKKTHLKEIAVFDSNCRLKAFSSLAISFASCPDSSDHIATKAKLGEEELIILYDLNFSLVGAIKENFLALVFITISTFLITTLGLFLFVRETFIKPISQVQKNIETGIFNSIPKEFNIFSEKIAALKDAISKHEKNQAYLDLARRVVHDIRNPLAFLNMHLEGKDFDIVAVKEKVGEIDYQVSNLLGNSIQKKSDFAFGCNLSRISRDLEYVFGLKVAVNDLSRQVLVLNLHEHELRNILSNLARNSKDAGATQLFIEASLEATKLNIKVSDNGHGVPKEFSGSVFTKGFTTKNDGNGIGLSSLRDSLVNKGGDLVLLDAEVGAQFLITIPCAPKTSPEIVFIDDDRYLRMEWQKVGKLKGVKVYAFASITDFMVSYNTIPVSTPIYLDSDLGGEVRGEKEARLIFEKGFESIQIVSSFQDLDLSPYPWIKGHSSKEPPFLS